MEAHGHACRVYLPDMVMTQLQILQSRLLLARLPTATLAQQTTRFARHAKQEPQHTWKKQEALVTPKHSSQLVSVSTQRQTKWPHAQPRIARHVQTPSRRAPSAKTAKAST